MWGLAFFSLFFGFFFCELGLFSRQRKIIGKVHCIFNEDAGRISDFKRVIKNNTWELLYSGDVV